MSELDSKSQSLLGSDLISQNIFIAARAKDNVSGEVVVEDALDMMLEADTILAQ
jgi:hypothetical protein